MNPLTRTFQNDVQEMNRLMNRLIGWDDAKDNVLANIDWTPAVDVTENNEAYTIKAELPEMKKEDVKVTVQNGVLTLSGERRQEKEEKGRKIHRIERSYGSFARSFTLPDNIDDSKIDAAFTDGVLSILLPKTATPKQNTREIRVS